MSALYEIDPDLAMAPSGTYPLWTEKFAGTAPDGRRFLSHYNAQGGQGAFRDRDGVSAVVFPGNIATTSVELFELEAPYRILSRELRPDSGGPGKFRGGLGQETKMLCLNDTAVQVAFGGGRFVEPALGRENGHPGAKGIIKLREEPPLLRAGRDLMQEGDVVYFSQPGGGGFGDPKERSRETVRHDIEMGYISEDAAVEIYGFKPEQLV